MADRSAHRTRRAVAGVLAALAMVAVAGCGGDDDDEGADADVEAVDADDGDGDEGGDEGGDDGGGDDGSDGADSDGAADDSGSADGGGGDFPIPAPDGLLLDVLVDSGIIMEGQRQLFYPDDDFDRLVAFYDDWTEQNGEWARTEVEDTVVYQRIDGEALRMITIAPEPNPGAQVDGPVTIVLLVASS